MSLLNPLEIHLFLPEEGGQPTETDQKNALSRLPWFILKYPETHSRRIDDNILEIPATLSKFVPQQTKKPFILFTGHNLRCRWFQGRQLLLERLKMACTKPVTLNRNQVHDSVDWHALLSLEQDIKKEITYTLEKINQLYWFQKETQQFLMAWKQSLCEHLHRVRTSQLHYMMQAMQWLEAEDMSRVQYHQLTASIRQLLQEFDVEQDSGYEASEKSMFMGYKKHFEWKLSQLAVTVKTSVSPLSSYDALCARRMYQLQQLANGEQLGDGTEKKSVKPSSPVMRKQWRQQLMFFIKSISEQQNPLVFGQLKECMQAMENAYRSHWLGKSYQVSSPLVMEILEHQEALLHAWYEKIADTVSQERMHRCTQLRQTGHFSELQRMFIDMRQSHTSVKENLQVSAPSRPIMISPQRLQHVNHSFPGFIPTQKKRNVSDDVIDEPVIDRPRLAVYAASASI